MLLVLTLCVELLILCPVINHLIVVVRSIVPCKSWLHKASIDCTSGKMLNLLALRVLWGTLKFAHIPDTFNIFFKTYN